jgi:tellurite resistance protein TehA-like permease
MTASVTQLRTRTRKSAAPASSAPATKGQSRALKLKMRRQAGTAIALGIVATIITALSLSHIAHGIQIVTGATTWEAWAFAIAIDVAMIVAEISMLFSSTPVLRKEVAKYASPFVILALGASAILNAFAFCAHLTDWYDRAPAICFGVAIPMMIYALTRIMAALYLNCDR